MNGGAAVLRLSAMSSLELARWQFGITTLYHFIFVPVTIGLAICVAIFQTRWYRTGDEHWLRSTRFWGKLMLISFALGVATGIVQEFQFGMAWSNYSRFVGDIFGAPLAMEGLAAFFVESTFLGLWIFGWGRLSKRRPPRLRLAGRRLHRPLGLLHPRRQLVDAAPGRLQAGGRQSGADRHLLDVLFNSTALYAFVHTHPRRPADRGDDPHRRLRLAPAARATRRESSPARCGSACRWSPSPPSSPSSSATSTGS